MHLYLRGSLIPLLGWFSWRLWESRKTPLSLCNFSPSPALFNSPTRAFTRACFCWHDFQLYIHTNSHTCHTVKTYENNISLHRHILVFYILHIQEDWICVYSHVTFFFLFFKSLYDLTICRRRRAAGRVPLQPVQTRRPGCCCCCCPLGPVVWFEWIRTLVLGCSCSLFPHL